MNFAALDSLACRFQVCIEPRQPHASPDILRSSASCNVEVLNDV